MQPTPEQAAELLADYQQWLYARGEKDRRIAALEAELAEAQARLAMAVEALRDAQKWATRWAQTTEHRDPNANDYGPYNQHPRGYAICPIPDWEVKQKRDDYAYALAATAETVAQHTASVERRGVKAALEAFAERDDWALDVPRSLVDRIRRLLTAEARAAEVERLDSDKT